MDGDDNVGLVSLLQSTGTSTTQDMDPEVMDFMPSEDEPGHVGPIYGPHLPGLEAGNSVDTAPNNSPVPSSFMAYDNPAPTILADIKDPSVQPGQSGLQNMGNTCFMNSVLQCLMHNSYLCHSLLGNCSFPPDSLTGRFVELLTKVWEGQYAVVHPSEFKEKLGLVHGQFKDFRQHDGQEFLALLLDTLHQELNWSTRQRKIASPATDHSEESDDSHYASEASSSKLSELEALDLDSVKDEPVNNRGAGAASSDSEASTSALDSLPGTSSDGASKDPVRLPSIEEFYKKDVKTLNTNMLQENEASVSLSTGSDKFPKKKTSKADRLRSRTENSFQKSPVKNKKTNVIAARKSRSHGALSGSNTKDALVNTTNECSSSTDDNEGIKRIKLDSSGGEAFDKPSNMVAANFHDYVVRGSGDVLNMGYDLDSDQLGLETLSRRLKQELDNGGVAQGCDSSMATKSSKSFQNKDDETISKLANLPSSTTTNAKNVQLVCTVNGEVVDPGEPHKNMEFIPNNKEHLSSLQLAKPLTSIEKNHEGERQWEDYLRRNESVVVDNFHGQLKNTVICQECQHVSIIYEPFMYLSVPLPRAMEKQFVVTFVRSGGQTPIRYAVVLNKTDTVTELRRTLLYTFYGEISGREIVLAEALDSHISRILEDGIQLQYVNSSFRLIYAFEIDYKPCVTVTTSDLSEVATSSAVFSQNAFLGSDQGMISSTSDFATLSGSQFESGHFGLREDWDLLSSEVTTSSDGKNVPAPTRRAKNTVSMEPDSTVDIGQEPPTRDIFTNMDSFKIDNLDEIPDLVGCTEDRQQHVNQEADGTPKRADTDEGITAESGNTVDEDISGTSGWEPHGEASAEGSVQNDQGTNTAGWGAPENVPPDELLTGDTQREGGGSGASTSYTQTEDSISATAGYDAGGHGPVAGPSSLPDDDDMRTEVGDQGQVSDVRDDLAGGLHVCIICLEEMTADQLLTHAVCQGKLCHQCVNRTRKHYGEGTISCPVCRADMDPATDFVPLLPNISTLQPLLRVLLLPVQLRNEWVENGERKMTLFGHPNVLYVMSKVSGDDLFSQLENIAPVSAEFTVALTDAQGLHCSRCPYDLQCSGCQLAREVDIDLSSDDHLTICFYDLTLQAMDEANRSLDHESMEQLRGDDPITLYDCFRAFTASEELDECNPWFCPECKKNQKAMKTMAIQKFPNTLIVYLKRFVFHQFMSTKLDNKVQFPVTDLSFSELIGHDCSLFYDLQSAVCHFGGVNSGHYTSYVKNPITSSWQYCNDETITEREPSGEDAENVYILFYQRKDTVLPFKLPSAIKLIDAPPSPCKEVEESVSPMDDQYNYSNSDDINKLVASLVQEGVESPLGGAEPVKVKEPFGKSSLDARLNELD